MGGSLALSVSCVTVGCSGLIHRAAVQQTPGRGSGPLRAVTVRFRKNISHSISVAGCVLSLQAPGGSFLAAGGRVTKQRKHSQVRKRFPFSSVF